MRGHSLTGANLQLRSRTIKGRDYTARVCVSCSRAHGFCGHRGGDVNEVSDKYYAEIMGLVPDEIEGAA